MLRSGIALAGANIWRFQGQEDPQSAALCQYFHDFSSFESINGTGD